MNNDNKNAHSQFSVGWKPPLSCSISGICMQVLLNQHFKEKQIHTENPLLPVLQYQLFQFFHPTWMPKAQQMVE